MLVQNHQIECALADVSPWRQWPYLVFPFQGHVQYSSRTSLLVLSALSTTSDMLPSNFSGPRSAAWLKSHSICKWIASIPASRGIQMFVAHMNIQVCTLGSQS